MSIFVSLETLIKPLCCTFGIFDPKISVSFKYKLSNFKAIFLKEVSSITVFILGLFLNNRLEY